MTPNNTAHFIEIFECNTYSPPSLNWIRTQNSRSEMSPDMDMDEHEFNVYVIQGLSLLTASLVIFTNLFLHGSLWLGL